MIKGAILSFALFIVSFFLNDFSLTQRAILTIPLILLLLTTIFYYKKKFFEDIKTFKSGYIMQISLISLVLIYSIIYNLRKHDPYYFIIPFVSLYALIFIFLISIPLVKYWRGVKVYFPKVFRVPVNGNQLRIRLRNFTPIYHKINFSLSLPQNASFKKENTREINRDITLKPSGILDLGFLLKSEQNNRRKSSILSVKYSYGLSESYIIEIVT